MRKFKRVFYSIYFLFLVISVLSSFNSEYMMNSLGIIGTILFLKYWVGLGFGLFTVEWIVENIHIKKLKNRLSILQKENTEIKARLYDLEFMENPMSGSEESKENEENTE
ncbi:MAG: hypothetical protein O6939_00775 [Bacteroidetes bacterium]|nr:hypothetical protein [Bacteroidota bacterium]MCZ6899242.1 hypothetical protein [Bacteroidota bacterium]